MRVIRNARNQPWKHIRWCKECHSKLEIVASDLSFVADCRDGNAYKFECPVCKHENWLAATLVPRGLVP
jgi:hypothetical protein